VVVEKNNLTLVVDDIERVALHRDREARGRGLQLQDVRNGVFVEGIDPIVSVRIRQVK
jgi:hypothetical protein